MSAAAKDEFECPACRGLIEEEWSACPHCGLVFDPPEAEAKPTATAVVLPAPGTGPSAHVSSAPARSAAPAQAAPAATTHLTAATADAPALPSVDTGEIPFAPSGGGPKRPITIMDELAPPPAGPALTLKSLIARDKGEDRIPPEPPTDAGRKAVTMIHDSTPIHDLAPPPPPAAAPVIEAPTTALAPTIVVVGPEPRETPARRLNEDLAAIERMINAAVAKALRENIAALSIAQPSTVALAEPVTAQAGRKRRVGLGTGLLVGGALGVMLALNYDTWIRGLANSVVGPLQQLGVIGTAALAGAGAGVVALQIGRARHRPKAHSKRSAARAH